MASEEAWRLARRRRMLAEFDEQNQMLTEILQGMTANTRTLKDCKQILKDCRKQVGLLDTRIDGVDQEAGAQLTVILDEFAKQAESDAQTIATLNRILDLRGIR